MSWTRQILATVWMPILAATAASAQTPPVPPAQTPPAVHAPAAHAPAVHPPPAHPGAPAHPAQKVPVVQPNHTTRTRKSVPPEAVAKPVAPPVVVPVPVKPAAPAAPPEPPKGSVTGLPLPRFVALKTDEVNFRAGPGTRYPIDWVYKRRDLPVEVQREFEVWRLVATQDGTKGWVHEATLTARRGFVVAGADRTMRSAADDASGAVAVLKVGVVGRIRACAAGADWCQVQVGEYRGWLKRSDFWGSYPGEVIQ